MSTKIKIMLNDEKSINELAKDEEVEIKIKEAIIDAVGKRVAKAIEGDIAVAVKRAISEFTNPKEDNGVFGKPEYWSGPLLSPKLCDRVHAIVKDKVRQEVSEIVDNFNANKEYVEAFNKRRREIEEYDFDAAVQKFISQRLSNSFSKLMK